LPCAGSPRRWARPPCRRRSSSPSTTPRLPTARRYGPWAAATNLRYGMETDLGYAAGLSLPAGVLGLGVALSGGIGDPHAFVEPPCRDPRVGAVVAWSFAPGWTTRAQAGAVLSGPMLVRMHLASEF